MKRTIALILSAAMLATGVACGAKEEPAAPPMEPKVSQMRAICELATMECYYHNVAKFNEKDAEGHLWWQKDKKFWIEYSGVVKLGVDASLVTMEADGDQLTITIPGAKIFSCDVDDATLTKGSYIVDVDSAKITGEDEVEAFGQAQQKLEAAAAEDKALLASAQESAKDLIEGYVTNIGNAVGKKYAIKWVYLNADGTPVGNTPASSEAPAPASSSSQSAS